MTKTTKSSRRLTNTLMLLSVCGLPFLMGAEGGGGCGGTFNSTKQAPNVSGNWGITYGATMDVDVKVGGSTYSQSMTSSGGTFTFMHQGTAFSFNVDCARPEVVCPSEVWPSQVAVDQRDPMYQFRMWAKIPTQTCNGTTVAPMASECGTGTTNPDCKPICTGTVTTSSADAFGLIRDGGTGFDLLLGGGFASNGINCALLGLSVASADLETTKFGSAWTASNMSNGVVKTGFAGGCLWAGPVDAQGKPSATVIGATVEIKTSFTGRKQ